MADLLALMTNRGFSPRKISTNNGGEYASSCPRCGDGSKGRESDRFHIWPQRESGGLYPGRFWCRQCGIHGDTIAFMQKIDGMSFQDACNELGIVLQRRKQYRHKRYQPAPALPKAVQTWRAKEYAEPGAIWQEKAGNLLQDCQNRLAGNQEAMAWLAGRGITMEIAQAYGLGFNLSSKGRDRYRPRGSWGLEVKKENGQEKKNLWIPRGWVIPSRNHRGELVQLRIRRMNEDVASFVGRIKYLPVDGSSMATMVLHPEAEVFAVVESGFDAVLLAGIMHGKIGTMTTWNSSARPDARAHALLSKASLVLGALDYDQGGDREQAWWSATYPQYRRLPALPGGAKDPGDAAAAGVDLEAWICSGLPRLMRVKLGFGKDEAVRKPVQRPAVKRPAAAKPAEVVEMELSNGTVVYITNSQPDWMELTRQGKPVFSENELQRLQAATATMNGDEKLAAAMKAIEAKEIFGGYIRSGRAFPEAEQVNGVEA